MKDRNYDFAGWATRYGLECSDGLTISEGAFDDCNGKRVPLVWNHQHNSNANVLGHAVLESRKEGVYAYGYLNDTDGGQRAKAQLKNGDIEALSIFANRLSKSNGRFVRHGEIKEVSMVLAGANPGAFIDEILAHSDDPNAEFEAQIWANDFIPLETDIKHSDDKSYDAEESNMNNLNDEIQEEQDNLLHAEDSEETVEDVINTMNEKQKLAMEIMVGAAIENERNSSNKEDNEMKHNVFEPDEEVYAGDVLTHADQAMIIGDMKRFGSMKESFLAHADDLGIEDITYGIGNIDYLFPDARNVNNTPEFIKRPTEWVGKVMSGVSHSPFSRIKTIFADITMDEARAKGYIKGKLKKEEVFGLLKRTTTPTTVYKKQKLDRDDIVDITDFNAVAWIKSEMRLMLDEELARAFLFGDGRSTADDDKINETNIRPILTDAELFTIKAVVEPKEGEDVAHAFIHKCIKARKDYRGSGSPSLFITEDLMADLLLLEDKVGRRIYSTATELANVLRVKEIIECPIIPEGVYGLLVNLSDYKVGADKGGEINMFDDFDIDYNQEKYLIETRCSGALIKPYSAIAFYEKEAGVDDTTEEGKDKIEG